MRALACILIVACAGCAPDVMFGNASHVIVASYAPAEGAIAPEPEPDSGGWDTLIGTLGEAWATVKWKAYGFGAAVLGLTTRDTVREVADVAKGGHWHAIDARVKRGQTFVGAATETGVSAIVQDAEDTSLPEMPAVPTPDGFTPAGGTR